MTTLLLYYLPNAGIMYGTLFFGAVIVIPWTLVVVTRHLGADAVAASSNLRVSALDGIDGHKDIITLGAIDEAQCNFIGAARRLAQSKRQLADWIALATASVQMLSGLALVAILWAGLHSLREGAVSGPVLVALLLASLGSFEASAAIIRSIGKLGIATSAAERLKAIAVSAPSVNDPAVAAMLPPRGDIEFQQVMFGYNPTRPVLQDVQLSIKDGERIAIQGPSGGGKSTLLALLLRLVDPQAGVIKIAGFDIRHVSQDNLHRHIALLCQDPPVFLGTIRDNLLIARPQATDAQLWQALEHAKLSDFVRKCAEGLDAYVGETGRTLSAGQARRLCLARTLLSPASILAFDEPTAGLDRETEAAFLIDLAAATSGRTVILVTHAELPPGVFDSIFILNAGLKIYRTV